MKFLDNIADRILHKKLTCQSYKPGFFAKWFVYYQTWPAVAYFQVMYLKWKVKRLDAK